MFLIRLMDVGVGCQADTAPVWTAVLASLAMIQHQQQCLADSMQLQQQALAQSQLAAAEHQRSMSAAQSTLLQRVVRLEQREQGAVQVADRHDRDAGGPEWTCPLCFKSLSHRHSFKGHIRRLVKQSTRPKCHLNPRDINHNRLVSRFAGADFFTKAANFCAHFYAFVARAISKSRPDDVSRRLVADWLNAAVATDGRAFPVCSCSSGDCDSDEAVVGLLSGDSSNWSSGNAA